jgi:hypothetical protein
MLSLLRFHAAHAAVSFASRHAARDAASLMPLRH